MWDTDARLDDDASLKGMPVMLLHMQQTAILRNASHEKVTLLKRNVPGIQAKG